MAQAHCNVAVIDIVEVTPEEVTKLRSAHEVHVEYYACDVSCKAQVVDTIARIERDFGRIDININAAGVVTNEPFMSTTEEDLTRTFGVNFYGSFLVAQACAASMIARVKASNRPVPIDPAADGGSIVFIGSISTHVPSMAQNISAYIGSKTAVCGLVKPLAVELAPFGIRVNSVSPGYMMTDMMAGLQQRQPNLVRQFQKETLLGGGSRIGRPEDLHGPLLMLCSRRAGAWVTGQDILVDGGAGSWKHLAALDECA